MGVLGVASSTLFNYLSQSVNLQTNRQQVQQEFQQLGKDLQSGNLSAAHSDFASLQQDVPQCTNADSQTPIGQAFSQLAQDLKSGNLSSAQQDYTTLQQDFQNAVSARQAMQGHRHHHHNNVSNSQSSAINQLFSELGTALQQDLLQFTQGGMTSSGSTSGSSGTIGTSGVSISA
jgi:outer membrane protein assembly factor BamD (BamD/ComL family)